MKQTTEQNPEQLPTKRRRGRPTLYKEEYAVQATKYCILGATNAELGRMFEVDTNTIDRWIVKYPEFRGALKKGREEADATVSVSLYRRAIGCTHKAVKIFADPKTGRQLKVSYLERYPPDTVACIFWLKNRRPDLWRDRQKLEYSGVDGAPIEVVDPDKLRDKLLDRIAGIAARLQANGDSAKPRNG